MEMPGNESGDSDSISNINFLFLSASMASKNTKDRPCQPNTHVCNPASLCMRYVSKYCNGSKLHITKIRRSVLCFPRSKDHVISFSSLIWIVPSQEGQLNLGLVLCERADHSALQPSTALLIIFHFHLKWYFKCAEWGLQSNSELFVFYNCGKSPVTKPLFLHYSRRNAALLNFSI